MQKAIKELVPPRTGPIILQSFELSIYSSTVFSQININIYYKNAVYRLTLLVMAE